MQFCLLSFLSFLLACLLYTMEKVLVLCKFASVIYQSLEPYDCVFLYCDIQEIIEIFDHRTKGIVCFESKAYSGVLNPPPKKHHVGLYTRSKCISQQT
jgi:hypothetical protein